jgi:pimeloyl-ACP methyl ester carboxylesterase
MTEHVEQTITHLTGIRSRYVETTRLHMHILTSGREDGDVVFFLHGNASSSTIWEQTLLHLPPCYWGIAPDLRGYGSTDPSAVIDATRGVQDWVDDVLALAVALRVDRFYLVGHSLGGFVCWGCLASYPQRLIGVTLIAPGPPCGFGGVRGLQGEWNNPDCSGSGAGLVQPRFAKLLQEGERGLQEPMFSPRAVMNRLFWKPPFRPAREEAFLSAMLQIHLGPRQYPGDAISSGYWPFTAPGSFGPVNALSPKYNRGLLSQVLGSSLKPPILWIQGTDDPIISDTSQPDSGYQGKMGYRPDWPGDEVFPPQPMLSQVSYALDQYARASGTVEYLSVSGAGHTPFVEQPEPVQRSLVRHLGESWRLNAAKR